MTATVVNVSARGLRLNMGAAERASLKVGQDVRGLLVLEDFEIRLSLRLIREIGSGEGGFRIRPPFPKGLERYLEPRFLGMSLREIDPAKLQRAASETCGMRWFQGLNETSLFSWEDGGSFVQQQLLFLERVVEWKGGDALKTGRIRGELPGLAGWVKADLLEFDVAIDRDLVTQARVLVENAKIDSKVKETFLSKINHVR